ncbi:MAG: hypothetical protein LBP55_07800 [Candidatus Adiutrix sp.]|jgi:3-deoxy-D-manno-octulosonic-acid transferase|nr:hypothetical protein [Candidatus Adiutrix sp.]
MRQLYRIAYALGFFVTWPLWLLRDFLQRKPFAVKERFLGPGRMLPKSPGLPRAWVWVLSLGEALAAKNLIPALEEAGLEVVISSTTATGRATVARLFPSHLALASPLDFNLSTRRFIESVAPDLLVLVETDIWPGVLFQLRQRNIPTALISARVSPRSLRGYGYIRPFWSRVLRLFNLITTQSEGERAALIALGADPAATWALGDLKFDCPVCETTPEARAALLQAAGWPDGRWIVAGSTHAGEEAIILGAFLSLKQSRPAQYQDLRLLLAPRNQSDFLAVRERLLERGLTAASRSVPQSSDAERFIFILDTLGELERFYDLAEIALVGKSWPGRHKGGGHNPLEPAARGKPVIFGPQMHNYRWMAQAIIKAGGALMTADQAALAAALHDLLSNSGKARSMGRAAADFVRAHQGVTARTMELLNPIIQGVRARSQPDD